MTAMVTKHLPLVAGAPDGIKKLRALIRDLAVTGRLVPCETGRDAWTWSTLGQEVAGMDAGWSPACLDAPSPSDDVWGVLRTTAVQPLRYVQDENKELPSKFAPRSEAEVKAGDVLFTRAGPMNRVGISCLVDSTRPKLMLSDKIIRFRPIAGRLDGRFTALCLNAGASARYLESAKSGMAASQVNISQAKLKATPIPVPPIVEQHRIVAKVDELMALCDRLEADQADAEAAHAQLVQALLDSLTQATDAADFRASWQRLSEHFHTLFTTEASIDALKQAVLQLAVMGTLVPQLAADLPAQDFLKCNKVAADEHPNLVGWATAQLGALGSVLGGATPSKANASYWIGDIPWVSPKDMKRPVIDDAEDHVSHAALEGSSLKAIPPRSILMVVRGMILAHSFPVAVTARMVTINQDMKALVPPPEIADYLLMFLQASKPAMVALVDRSSHGTCKLISEKLWSFKVSLPPLAEQHRIVAKVDELMALCDRLKAHLAEARQQHAQLATVLVEQAIAA